MNYFKNLINDVAVRSKTGNYIDLNCNKKQPQIWMLLSPKSKPPLQPIKT